MEVTRYGCAADREKMVWIAKHVTRAIGDRRYLTMSECTVDICKHAIDASIMARSIRFPFTAVLMNKITVACLYVYTTKSKDVLVTRKTLMWQFSLPLDQRSGPNISRHPTHSPEALASQYPPLYTKLGWVDCCWCSWRSWRCRP